MHDVENLSSVLMKLAEFASLENKLIATSENSEDSVSLFLNNIKLYSQGKKWMLDNIPFPITVNADWMVI
ncbi:hypothetical protein C4565_00675 [Candidatus Parcubacteria bacterium]|nr:MAG: hypothetical protein C4565_00675 [Candidatus Parcubacteria bacterium]